MAPEARRAPRLKMVKYKDYLYLDELRYSGVYDVTYYESKEAGVQIWIRNRQKPSKGSKGKSDKSIGRLVG